MKYGRLFVVSGHLEILYFMFKTRESGLELSLLSMKKLGFYFLQEAEGRVVAAVCAAPTALMAHGIAKGKKVTAYPCFKDDMEAGGYTYLEVCYNHMPTLNREKPIKYSGI